MHIKQRRLTAVAIQRAYILIGDINDMVGNGLDADFTLVEELERFIKEQEAILKADEQK